MSQEKTEHPDDTPLAKIEHLGVTFELYDKGEDRLMLIAKKGNKVMIKEEFLNASGNPRMVGIGGFIDGIGEIWDVAIDTGRKTLELWPDGKREELFQKKRKIKKIRNWVIAALVVVGVVAAGTCEKCNKETKSNRGVPAKIQKSPVA